MNAEEKAPPRIYHPRIRMSEETEKAIKIAAVNARMPLSEWLGLAIEEKLERDKK